MPRLKKRFRLRSGKVPVSIALTPDGWRYLNEMMEADGCSYPSAFIERLIRLARKDHPLCQKEMTPAKKTA